MQAALPACATAGPLSGGARCAAPGQTCACPEGPPCNSKGTQCSCDPGFSYDSSSQRCVDVDECAAGIHGCDANAACTNTPGSWTCACKSGWVLVEIHARRNGMKRICQF